MKRKFKDGRPVGARDKAPRRNSTLNRVNIKRALAVTHQANLPVSRIDITAATGDFSLIIGKPGEPEKINDLDQWIEKHHADAAEGH